MASEECNNTEDLTTDACPSPPRDSSKVPQTEFVNETKAESTSYTRSTKKKPKAKTVPKQVANVINISNSNGIHIGSNFTINMGNRQKNCEPQEKKKDIVKTEAICELMQRKDCLDTDVMLFVSEHIGEHWQDAMSSLGYSEGQIHQYYTQHSTFRIKEVVYQILLDWKQNKPQQAKVGALFTALWECEEKEVVRRMAENGMND